MSRISLSYLILLSFFASCQTIIEEENKVVSIARISNESTFMRNGATKFIYFYNSKKYKDVTSFDARIFGYGDMFIIYIDKSNPFKYIIPEPKIKIYNIEDFYRKCSNCITDTSDFKLTELAE